MRRTIVIAVVAGALGFGLASVSAFAAARLNIWRTYGEEFHLGYVVGYIDAVTLSQRKDPRVAIITQTGKNFSFWVKGVNDYFADPANAKRSVPDAMQFVSNKVRDKWLRQWAEKTGQASPSPSASPGV